MSRPPPSLDMGPPPSPLARELAAKKARKKSTLVPDSMDVDQATSNAPKAPPATSKAPRQPKKAPTARKTTFIGPTTIPLPPPRSRSETPATSRSTSRSSSNDSSRHPLERDLGAELRREFETDDALHAAVAAFDRRHLRPIAPPTQVKHDRAKKLWIKYFTLLLGDEEKANKTLERDAPFPALEQVKMFIYFCSTRGKSGLGIPGVTGWSHHTTYDFIRVLLSMRDREGAQTISPEDRKQLFNAIATWKRDKEVTTVKKDKRTLRECDFADLLAAYMNPSVSIRHNHMRLQMMGMAAFLYTHGTRPGSIVLAQRYEDTDMYLTWGDGTWVITGYEPGLGLCIHTVWVLRWGKTHRNDDSLSVNTSMRNLGRIRMHLDAQLIIEALAIDQDIFTEDLFELRQNHDRIKSFPYRLEIKEECKPLPIFCQARDKSRGLTLTGAAHFHRKATKFLNWENGSFYALRYSFASSMVDRVSEVHLKYLMGHTIRSTHAFTTYQRSNHELDVAGVRWGEEDKIFGELAAAHSSVAWNRPTPPDDSTLQADPRLSALLKEYQQREKLVWQSFQREIDGKPRSVVDLWEAGNEQKVVTVALEALADLWSHYESLSMDHEANPDKPPPADEAERLRELKLQEALFEQLSSGDGTLNPILAVIAGEDENPRLEVIRRYIAFIRMTQGTHKGACPWCLCDANLDEAKAGQDRSRSFVQHVASCELSHNPNTWRCVVCKTLVPVPPKRSKTYRGLKCDIPVTTNTQVDDDMEESRRQEIQDEYDEHCAGCYETLLAKIRGEPTTLGNESESDSEDEGESDVSMRTAPRSVSCASDISMGSASDGDAVPARVSPSSSRKGKEADAERGPRVLSLKITFTKRYGGQPQRTTTFYFCPVHLFDTDSPWHQRLMVFDNLRVLRNHIALHWGMSLKCTLDYKKEIECGFPKCETDKKRTLGDAIEHLHHEHGYPMLRCNTHCSGDICDPDDCKVHDSHTDTCFKLEPKFLFHDDARIWADSRIPDDLRRDMPATTLVEDRRVDVTKRWHKNLFANMNGEGKKKKTSSSVRRVEPFELEKTVKKKRASAATTEEEAPATTSPQTWRLCRCLTEIVADEKYQALDVSALSDQVDSLTKLIETKKEDISGCGIEAWSKPLFQKFVAAVKKWRRATEITECVNELVKAGLVAVDLCGMLLAEEHVDLHSLLSTSAGDMSDYGLEVDEDRWVVIQKRVATYLEENQ